MFLMGKRKILYPLNTELLSKIAEIFTDRINSKGREPLEWTIIGNLNR